jgi:type VI secretion system protein ImpK
MNERHSTQAARSHSASQISRRIDNLAAAYQELLTVIVRLRANQHNVTEPSAFRAQIRASLKTAEDEAASKGYAAEDIKVATFAVVGFLDESILNQNPNLADWIRRPLQQELFGVQIAGEIFFRNVDRLLTRSDSQELADVLEIYELCLLLGFHGRYSTSEGANLRAIAATLDEKIRRIRGDSWPAVSAWRPEQARAHRRASRLRNLSWTTVAIWVIAVCLFLFYTFVLRSTVSEAVTGASAIRL